MIEFTDRRPFAVKALNGETGRGLHVLVSADGNLPRVAPFVGPFMVQEYVHSDATVCKIYVVGSQTSGLLKNAGTSIASQYPRLPIDIDPDIADMALLAGAALDIEFYGVDFLFDRDGPKIIDVNPFPGFRKVSNAARRIATYLSEIVVTPR